MISVADSFEPHVVDLLGVEYETTPRTRSVTLAAQKLGEKEGDILDDENASPDAQVDYLAKMIALRLKPRTEDALSADKHLLSLWKDDRLSIDQVLQLIDDLQAAESGKA
jgi:hypothetical protein